MARAWVNIPNLITTIRIFFIPLLIYLILNSKWFGAVILLAIAFLSDLLDGLVARATKTETTVGVIYDSAVDKIFMAAAVIALIIRFDLPIFYFLLILTRDILATILFVGFSRLMKKKRVVIGSNIYGKVTTVFQFFTLIAIIFYSDIAVYFVYVAFFLGLGAGVNYYFEYRKKLL
ncbi:CDP-alcohol phosphatidyltransferase family protein [Candidatus Woesearchaeota archaeon]|nr:CDP-alcohol phosphatidyltransferase family protein [Candidatus Woesearchaeota archaeon]